ncbi:MAG: group I intron-associated PD-(D/E)XK endonuclease [Candidatus Omnitrophica bacterium]|nr:group I intron-associated PD-(D/E)XK endonuclease [Candidatus Omnitrophota bacterium]
MDTKLKSDIAESAVILKLLEKGFNVLKPFGDRLAYDLAIDQEGRLIRIQVKSAWYSKDKKMHLVDARRTKTNRRKMIRKKYSNQDFDFAIIYLSDKQVFYIMPVEVFNNYASSISFVEEGKRQRPPKSAKFRERWDLLSFCGLLVQ